MIINRILGLLAITVLVAGVTLGLTLLPADASWSSQWDGAMMEVVICHQTGSDANPWRPMKVNPAEASHYLATGDQLAEPDGGCPAETAHPAKGSVEICAYTGSKDELWVRMSISPSSAGRYEVRGARPYDGSCD